MGYEYGIYIYRKLPTINGYMIYLYVYIIYTVYGYINITINGYQCGIFTYIYITNGVYIYYYYYERSPYYMYIYISWIYPETV